MSNSDYENRLRAEQRALEDHRRKQIELATITANAAVQAANTAEKARLEQKQSLERQEYIANTNTFRNSVLNALPIIKEDQRTQFLIEQISSRIPAFESGSLLIAQNELAEYSGLNKILNDYKQSGDFQQWYQLLIEKQNLTLLHEKACDKLYWWHWNPNSNPIVNLVKLYFVWVVGTVYVIGLLMYFGARKNRKNTKDALDDFLSKNEAAITVGPEKLKKLLIQECIKSRQIQDFKTTEPAKIASEIFDSTLSDTIKDEQSFLPGAIRPSFDDWKKTIINEKTISMISFYQKNLPNTFDKIAITPDGAIIDSV
jgi:hypothetical protein